MEGILLLATLGQAWRLRLAPGQVAATQPIITLRPKFGMRMIVAAARRGTIGVVNPRLYQ